jgi:hypothetical protein
MLLGFLVHWLSRVSHESQEELLRMAGKKMRPMTTLSNVLKR